MPKTSSTPVATRKLVLSKETVRTLTEQFVDVDAATGCGCPTRCTCTTNLC